MHIAEGMLPMPYAIAYGAGAATIVAIGIKDINRKRREIPMIKQLAGVMTAGVFLISLLPVPVPFTGTSSHPGGTPLCAILLGPWITTVISLVSLLFQALFFAHGGLTTLGANTLTLGLFGGVVGWLIFRVLFSFGANLFWAGTIAGLIGNISIYVGTSIQLSLALHGSRTVFELFKIMLAVFAPTQVPLAIIEGLFTGFVLNFIFERRPDILEMLRIIKGKKQTAKISLTRSESW